jgi:hypothetical protein
VDNLTQLELSGVPWTELDNNENYSVYSLEQLIYKYRISLSDEVIRKNFHTFDQKNKGYLNDEEMTKFNAFVFKRFPRLGSELKSGQNVLSGIPGIIFTLTNLTSLNLSYQAIRFVPKEIKQLKQLEELILKNCILLETVGRPVGELLLIKTVDLEGCISLQTPPLEIIKRGRTAVLAYLKRLSTGSILYKRTKLMLVGLGEAGKTSLVNSLTRKTTTHQRPEITNGIDIQEWVVDLPDQTKLTFSIWDFGRKKLTKFLKI